MHACGCATVCDYPDSIALPGHAVGIKAADVIPVTYSSHDADKNGSQRVNGAHDVRN